MICRTVEFYGNRLVIGISGTKVILTGQTYAASVQVDGSLTSILSILELVRPTETKSVSQAFMLGS